MIPAHEYRSVGEPLPVGKQVNINHVMCNAGTDTRGRLYIKRLEGAVVSYCHNCGEHGYVKLNNLRSITDLLKANDSIEKGGHGDIELPHDCIPLRDDWPNEAASWLWKYGITAEEVVNNNITYSPSWNRLILPVYDGGKLVFWQGRAVNSKQTPKYVNARAVAKPMATFLATHNPSKVVVIVEDILSAIKVSRCVDSIALLGTSPDFDCLREKVEGYAEVVVWLDNDSAGVKKSVELANRLSLVVWGVLKNFSSIYTQPKEIDDPILADILGGL